METKIDNNALTETYVILNKLKLYYKLPDEFQKYIEMNKNNDYNFDFNENIPLFNQLKNDTTKNLISFIYIKYINDSEKNSQFYEHEIEEILNRVNDSSN